MSSQSGLELHRELVKSLENAKEKAEMLECGELADSIEEDLMEAAKL
jgi:type II secretory pathway component PulF